jgi:predicted phage terminase large subunit-like protein
MTRPVKLTADIIEAFSGSFLSPRYDDPKPTPAFHRLGWSMYASEHSQCALAAPRDHAKSTSFTFDYILAECLFRTSDYTILIGSTEDKSAEQLSNISEELHENRDLIEEFGIKSFESDTKTDIIVRMDDGHRFRVLARGAEQKIRGALWKGKRPNLLVCDDMEDDEQVENKERRKKFRRWFFRAAKQALSRSGKIRVHGTILHEDSLLARLMKNKTWNHLFFKAHRSFDDFSEILWPEAWSETKLRSRRQEFIEDDDAPGYSQEFLNTPLDDSTAYLRRTDFIAMDEADHKAPKKIAAAADFAVSKADLANRTSFTIGGKCPQNRIHFLDQRVDRWDTVEWIDEMFSIQEAWSPETFYVEDGVIWKAVRRMVYNAMEEKDCFINIEAVPSIKDKATRGQALRKRMRAHNCRFDKAAEWYPGFEDELLKFTGASDALKDDQFDSASLLVLGLEHQGAVAEEDFEPEEEQFMRRNDPRRQTGRNEVTGY